MSRGRVERGAPGIVLTAEHASNRVPKRYAGLGGGRSHVAWDEGSSELARALARALDAPLFEGRWSRLLIDLNRSLHHRRLIPAVSFGEPVPGNEGVTPEGKRFRVETYYRPFRETVRKAVQDAIDERGRCLHVSVHTFAPVMAGVTRNADVGVLYDPARGWERAVADELVAAISRTGLRVRRNYPYRGTADGHTTHLRRLMTDERYAGIELEVNQRLSPVWSRAIGQLVACVRQVVRDEAS